MQVKNSQLLKVTVPGEILWLEIVMSRSAILVKFYYSGSPFLTKISNDYV